MNDSLINIKNNLKGNKSRVDEAENQINDLEHKEAKNNQSEQQDKKESKKLRIVQAASETNSSFTTFIS